MSLSAEDIARMLYPGTIADTNRRELNIEGLPSAAEQNAQLKREVAKMEEAFKYTYPTALPVKLEVQLPVAGYPAVDRLDTATKAFVEALHKEENLGAGGGRVNYYLVDVKHPQRENQVPYQAECEDIIEALGLNFDEGNIFKEIWRTANERTHGKGKPGNNPLRAAEKIKHYADRILKRAKR